MRVTKQSGKSKSRSVGLIALSSLLTAAVLLQPLDAQLALSQSLPDEQFDQLHNLISTNTLAVRKSRPFHIRISFTLDDLIGQEKEKGSVESWWLSPGSKKTEIAAPSYQDTEPGESNKEPHVNRERYLIDELLQSFIQPVPIDFLSQGQYLPAQTTTGDETSSLRCIVRRPANQPAVSNEMSRFCMETGSYALIKESGAGELLIEREAPHKFHSTTIPSKVTISYLGKPAISGTIDVLEDMTIDSADAGQPTTPMNPGTPVDSTILAGLRLSARNPVYPRAARKAHQHGSVTISAIIDKEGKLRDLDIIATPNDLFSQSALEAVKTWTYRPYLLNGRPTEVDTTIYVNYNIGR